MVGNRNIAAAGLATLLLLAAQVLAPHVHGGLSREVDAWHGADVVEADSLQARAFEDDEHVGVRLPDASPASMVLDDGGRPRALVLPSSNTLAAKRDRALEMGAIETVDRQVVLPATTQNGERVDFVIGPDGRTRVIRLE